MINSKNFENFIFVFIFFLSTAFLLFRYTYDSLPGDLGDTIFSIFLLESFHNSIINNNSFTDLPYQFPLKNNIYFSETMWGSAWIYSIFRFIGNNTIDSFKFYFITCSLLNYIVCYFVLRKLKLSIQSSLIAAFLFSFSLPILAHDVRPQLLLRFYTPLSFYFYYRYLDNFELKYVVLSFLFVFLQILSSMYLGIFLIIFLIITHIIKFSEKKKINNLDLKTFFKVKIKSKVFIIIFLILVGCFFYYIFSYYSIKNIYEFKRSYPESALINIFSFFTTERSFLGFYRILPNQFPLGEQQLYLGVSFYIVLFIFFKNRKFLSDTEFSSIMKKATFINLLLYTSFFGISFFLILYYMPGLSGLRAPVRSILIILFPISFILGLYIDEISKIKFKKFFLIKYLLVFFLLSEILSAKLSMVEIKSIENRISQISKKINNSNKNKILVFKHSDNYVQNYHDDVFRSLYTVMNNLKTFNGYTSFVPEFSRPFKNCSEFDKFITELNKFHDENNLKKRKFENSEVTFINFEKDCFISD